MYPRVKISRKIACSLMLVMYMAFLCFQVRYNLGTASTTKLHLQVANEKHAFSEKLIAKQKHGAVLAKSKAVPTKRFHPKVASLVPQYFVTEPVVYNEPSLRFDHSDPFIQNPALSDASGRGPPSILFC
jgi:hypothetical protein